MKKILSAITILSLCLFFTGCRTEDISINENRKLVLYTYESLNSEWGLLPQVLDQFRVENNLEVEVVTFTDAGLMLNQLVLEKDNPKADVVLGLDNLDYERAVDNNLLTAYQPERFSEIDKSLLFDEQEMMIPFDYGYVGFVYNSEKIEFSEPISLKDLVQDQYKDKIIIEQPGLSSPGSQLLLWSRAALGENEFDNFWTNFKNNLLTVAPDWNTAYYSMFMEDEAPIVLSYLTSPAYHIDQEQTEKYKAIPIREGYVRQVEGVGIINKDKNQNGAQKFIDYILTDEVQNKIPQTQWMFPVLGNKESWPEAFSHIIVPQDNEILEAPAEEFDSLLSKWNMIFEIK